MVALVNDTVGTLMACSSIYRDCKVGVILGTGTNACYFENLENVPKWTGAQNQSTKQVVINTEWGAFGKVGERSSFENIAVMIRRECSTGALISFERISIVNWTSRV